MIYEHTNWRRYTPRELIYFVNFVNSSLRARRLELLAEHQSQKQVAKLCNVTPACISQHVRQAIREALWRIRKMQQLESEFGAGQNAATQLYYFYTETRIFRQQRAKKVEADLALLKAQLKAKRTELRALKR